MLRLVAASAAGGAYSFILLARHLPAAVSVLSKVLAAIAILLIAFRFYRVKHFLRSLLVFLFSNFVFLGVTVGSILLLHAERIRVNNGVAYFDIGARGLIGCALVAYGLSVIVIRLYNRHVAKSQLFWVTAEKDGNSVSFFAFADTGNRLREPFSGVPVIVADSETVLPLAPDGEKRIIPASTVGGRGYYEAFRPDRLRIRTDKGEEIVDNVYIALSDHLKAEDYSAVLNPEILSV